MFGLFKSSDLTRLCGLISLTRPVTLPLRAGLAFNLTYVGGDSNDDDDDCSSLVRVFPIKG